MIPLEEAQGSKGSWRADVLVMNCTQRIGIQ